MNGNDIVAVANNSAVAVVAGGYTIDNTNPTLVSFDLDLDTETMTLTFSETVSAPSANASALILANEASGAAVTHRIGLGTFSQANSTVLTVNISRTDINEI
jgi:hypothetical protein